jgi:hypothetical protein
MQNLMAKLQMLKILVELLDWGNDEVSWFDEEQGQKTYFRRSAFL